MIHLFDYLEFCFIWYFFIDQISLHQKLWGCQFKLLKVDHIEDPREYAHTQVKGCVWLCPWNRCRFTPISRKCDRHTAFFVLMCCWTLTQLDMAIINQLYATVTVTAFMFLGSGNGNYDPKFRDERSRRKYIQHSLLTHTANTSEEKNDSLPKKTSLSSWSPKIAKYVMII